MTYTLHDGQYHLHAESTDMVDTFYRGKEKSQAEVKTPIVYRSPSVFVAYIVREGVPFLLTHGTQSQMVAWVRAHPDGLSGGHKIVLAEVKVPVDVLNKGLEDPLYFPEILK